MGPITRCKLPAGCTRESHPANNTGQKPWAGHVVCSVALIFTLISYPGYGGEI